MKKKINVNYAIEMKDDSWGDMLYKTLNDAKQIRNKYYQGANIYKIVDYIDTNTYEETSEEILLKV